MAPQKQMHEHGHILVLDDEKNIVTVLKAILEKRGYAVDGFTEPKEALHSLRSGVYDVAITDLYMPEIDGMAFLAEASRLYPGLPVIMITAFGTVDSAVDAIKKGAFDYVTKPFEQSEIVNVVQKAVNSSRLKRLEVEASDLPALDLPKSILLQGKSPLIQEMQKLVQKTAKSPSTVLLLGDAGTGKEYLAEEIHRLSDRGFQALLKLNCAALSSLSMENEIFGSQNKPGKIEMAHKGTLFLDEVSELPADLQHKLWGFLESGTFENPMTGEKVRADVRIIASSNKDLLLEVKEGRFREDLFYKLNVVPVHVPSLKDRREDMPELVDYFLKQINKRLQKNIRGMDATCLQFFQNVAWPGNLRQLEHVLERMMLLCDGSELKEKNIPADLKAEMDRSENFEASRFREIVRKQTQNLEKDLIERALDEMEGNITKTAEHLGISRKGLQLKMKELGIRQGS